MIIEIIGNISDEGVALVRRSLRHKNWRLKRKLKWVGCDEPVWPTEIQGRWADGMSAAQDHSMDCLRYAMDTKNYTLKKPKRFLRWLYEFLFCWWKNDKDHERSR